MGMRRPSLVCCAAVIGWLLLTTAPTAQAPPPPSSPPAPYRILVTDDDGVRAPGILALAQALQTLGEVTVAAPSENQTGKGHSITIADPILVDPVTVAGAVRAFSIVAPPATCVAVAVRALLPERPNLVVSGINHGFNVGMVTYVSGTVGAAREAALMGIPAIASSLASEEVNYGPAAQIVRRIAEMVRANGVQPGVFLNVNIPAGAGIDMKPLQLTRQSALTGEERFEEQRSPSGRRLFWSVWKEPTGGPEGTDVWATEHGYTSITPLRAGEFDQATFEAWQPKMPH
jgi:5'/3'-nucleotidase